MIFTDGSVVTNRFGDALTIDTNVKRDIDSNVEGYLRNTGDNNTETILYINGFINWLKDNDYYDNMVKLYLMSPISTVGVLVEFKVNSPLTNSGDGTWTYEGISGDGSYYYDTKFNPSSGGTDINNWAFGISSVTDNDAGVDLGCSDGANEHYIKCKASGDFVVKNGTTAITVSSQDNGIGNFTCSTQSGTVKAFWNGIEQGSSAAVGGGLADLTMDIGGLNDDSVHGSFSAKRYSTAWVYNGVHDDTFIQGMSDRIDILNNYFNRGYGIS